MKSSILWIGVVLVIVGVWYFVAMKPPQSTIDSTNILPVGETAQVNENTQEISVNPTEESDESSKKSEAPIEGKSTVVKLAKDGFTPSKITIKKGETVVFKDEGGGPMWVGSAMHPAHLVYDGTSKDEHCVKGYSGVLPFDQCTVGPTYSFTFDKTGSWFYHNHVNSSQFGSVTVE